MGCGCDGTVRGAVCIVHGFEGTVQGAIVLWCGEWSFEGLGGHAHKPRETYASIENENYLTFVWLWSGEWRSKVVLLTNQEGNDTRN